MEKRHKPAVVVTRPIYPDAMERLREATSMTVPSEDRGMGRAEVLDAIRGRQGLISMVTDRVCAELMDASGGTLQVVANHAVGFDNVDLTAASERGIQVSNTPGVLTESTADLAWGLILCAARGLVQADAVVRKGLFTGWGPNDHLGHDVHGATLGIIGMGRIGQAVARRASGFRMRVLYFDMADLEVNLREGRDPGLEAPLLPRKVPLEKLLEESDFVTLHVNLSDSTRRMIGTEQLRRMKPTAYLVNTSRGKVIDEAALVAALREGWIAGAGLDVFENEPALAEGLAELPNVVLLPHIGSATHATRRAMSMIAVENLLCGLQGRRVPNLVNTEVAVSGE